MRAFGLVMFAGCGVLVLMLSLGGRTAALPFRVLIFLLCVVGIGTLLISRIAPHRLLRFYSVWMAAGMRVGAIVSGAALILTYIVVVVPVGLIMKASGRDPLERTPRNRVATAFHSRTAASSADRFERLF